MFRSVIRSLALLALLALLAPLAPAAAWSCPPGHHWEYYDHCKGKSRCTMKAMSKCAMDVLPCQPGQHLVRHDGTGRATEALYRCMWNAPPILPAPKKMAAGGCPPGQHWVSYDHCAVNRMYFCPARAYFRCEPVAPVANETPLTLEWRTAFDPGTCPPGHRRQMRGCSGIECAYMIHRGYECVPER